MQTITITGFLSKDAEIRNTQGGDQIANWNVPVRQGFGDKEKTNWFRVSIWGKRADFAGKARKGDAVTVTGELTIGEYDGKPQYEIRANDFQSIRPAPRDGSNGAPAGGTSNRAQEPHPGAHVGDFADDSDLPF
jgi:single-strand DNA-binding protein